MFFSQKYLMFPLCLIQLPYDTSPGLKKKHTVETQLALWTSSCPIVLAQGKCQVTFFFYCAFPENIPYFPTEGIGISQGWGVRPPKNFKKCMKLNGNFQRGGRVLEFFLWWCYGHFLELHIKQWHLVGRQHTRALASQPRENLKLLAWQDHLLLLHDWMALF